MNVTSTTPPVRQEMYSFIHDTLGVVMSEAQAKECKRIMMAHADARTEDLLAQISELQQINTRLKLPKLKRRA